MVPTQLCGVFQLASGKLLVEGIDYEPSGPGGLASNRHTVLSGTCAHAELGAEVLRELAATEVVRGGNHDFKAVVKSRKRHTGIQSEREFNSSSKYVSVSRSSDVVTVSRSVFEATHGGWHRFLPADQMKCPPDPETLGRTIRQLLEKSNAVAIDD